MRRNAIFVLVLTVKPALKRFYTASAISSRSQTATLRPEFELLDRHVGGPPWKGLLLQFTYQFFVGVEVQVLA